MRMTAMERRETIVAYFQGRLSEKEFVGKFKELKQ